MSAMIGMGFLLPGFAANPLTNLFKRVEADPNKDYAVKDTNGPWMIMATVFRGDKAMDDAKALVLELRKSHACCKPTTMKKSAIIPAHGRATTSTKRANATFGNTLTRKSCTKSPCWSATTRAWKTTPRSRR
ncbi:MAG: hypothetical protein QM811_02445 [Pirellulales bacterium]